MNAENSRIAILPFSINYIINFIVSRCNTLRWNTFSRTENSMDLINFCLNIVEKREIIAIVYTLGLILSQGYSRFLITSSISNLEKKRTRRIAGGKESLSRFASQDNWLKESSNALIVHCHSVSLAQDASLALDTNFRSDLSDTITISSSMQPVVHWNRIYIYLRNHFRDHPVFVTQPRRYSIETAVISSRLNRDIGLTSISLRLVDEHSVVEHALEK